MTLRFVKGARPGGPVPPQDAIDTPHLRGKDTMANIVKAALLQTDWAGDKESMIDKH